MQGLQNFCSWPHSLCLAVALDTNPEEDCWRLCNDNFKSYNGTFFQVLSQRNTFLY